MAQDSRHRRHLKAIVEVNMTPLMDLTFMLLIVFIITVPILDYKQDITLSEMTTDQQVGSTAKNIMISIDKSGGCIVAGVPVEWPMLESALAAQAATHPDGALLRADGSRPLDEIVAVMRAARKADIKLELVTEEEETPRKPGK